MAAARASLWDPRANRDYAVGLARAFAGAIIFGLPLLMTMEMWFMGFYLDRLRLALFLVLNLFILVGLSRFVGFEPTSRWVDDAMDALAAMAVGILASTLILVVFAILGPRMHWGELVGKIAIQAIPASFGAMIARKQLHGEGEEADEQARQERAGYGGELFLMMAGALFVAFNVAPTEEMVLIGYAMTEMHGIALVLLSMLLLHTLVYSVGFAGQEQPREGTGFRRRFFGYSIAGYGIALAVSLYVLWTFGRTDGADLREIAMMTAVLAFPAAVGAAIARLVV